MEKNWKTPDYTRKGVNSINNVRIEVVYNNLQKDGTKL